MIGLREPGPKASSMKINVGGSFLRFRNFNGNNLIRALAKFTKIDSIHFQNI